MKEKITMLAIAIIVILILSWAVIAMASSYNMITVVPVHHGVDQSAVEMDTDLSNVATDASRPRFIPPDTEVAKINR